MKLTVCCIEIKLMPIKAICKDVANDELDYLKGDIRCKDTIA